MIGLDFIFGVFVGGTVGWNVGAIAMAWYIDRYYERKDRRDVNREEREGSSQRPKEDSADWWKAGDDEQ